MRRMTGTLLLWPRRRHIKNMVCSPMTGTRQCLREEEEEEEEEEEGEGISGILVLRGGRRDMPYMLVLRCLLPRHFRGGKRICGTSSSTRG